MALRVRKHNIVSTLLLLGSLVLVSSGCDMPSKRLATVNGGSTDDRMPEREKKLEPYVQEDELKQINEALSLQREETRLFEQILDANDKLNASTNLVTRFRLARSQAPLRSKYEQVVTRLEALKSDLKRYYWAESLSKLPLEQAHSLEREALQNWNPLAYQLKMDLSSIADTDIRTTILKNVASLPLSVNLGVKQSWFSYVSLPAALDEYSDERAKRLDPLAASQEVASRRAGDIAKDIRAAVQFEKLQDCLSKNLDPSGELLIDDALDKPAILDSLAKGSRIEDHSRPEEHISAVTDFGDCYTLATHAYAAVQLAVDTQALTEHERQILRRAHSATQMMLNNLYKGHNSKLLDIQFREPVPGNSGNIDSFIQSERYLVGSIWWTKPSQVAQITGNSSKSPLKFLYGPMSERSIFWPIEFGQEANDVIKELVTTEMAKASSLTEENLRRRTPHLDSFRIAVNYSEFQGKRSPRSVEIFAKDAQNNWQAFVYYKRASKWLPSKSFVGKTVPAACESCHLDPNTGRMSPRPHSLVSGEAKALERGYHPDFVPLILKY